MDGAAWGLHAATEELLAAGFGLWERVDAADAAAVAVEEELQEQMHVHAHMQAAAMQAAHHHHVRPAAQAAAAAAAADLFDAAAFDRHSRLSLSMQMRGGAPVLPPRSFYESLRPGMGVDCLGELHIRDHYI